ncbi:TIGR04282 family arsenosugar biosynthesis glycosyltransferase [Pseudonocardia spinosispora]|uniref:TIGR04282 family arsenosugar biosynthesis glycosyltransferase n=1 Tax=Pseudonocardia spinosispora TaxID=103441 RepID=UPI000427B2E6|nr:TIGR04282 family arsenosugar biosynthesis glycosyltransferase [Pseudonocardia spinosispora]
MTAPDPVLLVLAKSPVAGRAKTRLCPPASPVGAARIAAASLLDTVDAVSAVPGATPMVAWSGELADAQRHDEVVASLAGVVRFEQRGGTLGERIAAAHAEVADRAPGSAVLQIGMDTPQAGSGVLTEALRVLGGRFDAVLGPALDGGWWALGLRDPRAAALVASVPTSRDDTGDRTLHALRAAGLTVALLPELRDVDTAEDALAVAGSGSAGRRFAAEVASVLGAARLHASRS